MFQKNIPEVFDGVDSCGGGGGDERGLQGGHPAGGGVSREQQVSTDKPKVSEAVVSDWIKEISRIFYTCCLLESAKQAKQRKGKF